MSEVTLTETQLSDIAAGWDTMKQELKRSEDERKKYGEQLTETKGKLEELHKAIESIEEKNKDIETRLKRPGGGDPELEAKQRDEIAVKVFDRFMRGKGASRGEVKWADYDVTDERERKALATDQATEGGWALPRNLDTNVISYLREIDEIWQIAMVKEISKGDSAEFVLENSDNLTASNTTERGTRAETGTPGFYLKQIFAHEQYAFPYITQKMLEDADFDTVGWLIQRVSERFAQLAGADFIEGTGLGEGYGLLTRLADSTLSYVAGGHATELPDADPLIEIVDDMHPRYSSNGSWLMNRATKRLIRQLKDGTGNYIWERSIQGGQPSRLLDHPIYSATNMDGPSSGAWTTNQYPAIFGDFRQGYCIVRRKGMDVLRDPYSAKPYIGYYCTYRVGGDVLDPAALVALKIATS